MFRALFCCLANSSITLWAYTKSQKSGQFSPMPGYRLSCKIFVEGRRGVGAGVNICPDKSETVKSGVFWNCLACSSKNLKSQLSSNNLSEALHCSKTYIAKSNWLSEVKILKQPGMKMLGKRLFIHPWGGVESHFFAKYAPAVFVGQLLNSARDRAAFAFITPTWALY